MQDERNNFASKTTFKNSMQTTEKQIIVPNKILN